MHDRPRRLEAPRGRTAALAPLAAALLLAGCSGAAREGGGPAVGASEDGGEAVTPGAGCTPAAGAERAPVNSAYGVTYAVRGGEALQLDVASPRAGGPRPLVVLLHGGGWSGGSRGSLHAEMLALARLGYAAATVQYRLAHAPVDVFPAAVGDVRCAVRFLQARAADYGIDPTRVAAAGFSAGAHLASLLGTAPDVAALDDDGGCASPGEARMRAVVSYAGPQDLRVNGPYTQEQADLVTNFLGVFPGDAPERATLASPIAHVRAGAPPFLLVHGTRDDLVPVAHARRMAAALRRAGTAATVLELPDRGHEFVGLTGSANDRVRCTTRAFLERWLGAPADSR